MVTFGLNTSITSVFKLLCLSCDWDKIVLSNKNVYTYTSNPLTLELSFLAIDQSELES